MPQPYEREPVDREEVVHVDESGGPVERHEVVKRGNVSGREADPSVMPSSEEPVVEHRERIVQNVAAERHLILHKAAHLIWWVVTVVDGMIALRIVLKLIAANPGNPFAAFVYDFTAVFLRPFFGLAGTPAAGSVVLEVSSLIAIGAYTFATWAVVRLLWLIFAPTTARSATTYDRYRR